MRNTLNVGDWVDDADALDRLPTGSVVIAPESEHGDHPAWQLTSDVLDEDMKHEDRVWASVFYKGEHTSQSLCAMSHTGKVLVVYIKPA